VNLAAKCASVPLLVTDSPKLIAIQTKDSFDAAKILLPSFQEEMFRQLGTPFCFAVPNQRRLTSAS
jgi:uncharacterized protein YtpQ (UPF0354 family)